MRRAFAALVAFIAYRALRIRRRHVEEGLLRAGLPATDAKYMYEELATSLAELLAVAAGRLLPRDVVTIPEHTARRLREARAKGPVVLFCAHTSNWELVAMQAATLFPLAAIVKPQSVGAVERVIGGLRARFGVRAIHPSGAMQEARAAHARGEIVATVIDQVPARRAQGDLVPFLGAPALVDRAPAVLARFMRAHVFVIFSSRREGGVVTDLALELSPAEVSRLSAHEIMARATASLDAHVRRHPSSWLWLHRRWKMVPALTARTSERLGARALPPGRETKALQAPVNAVFEDG